MQMAASGFWMCFVCVGLLWGCGSTGRTGPSSSAGGGGETNPPGGSASRGGNGAGASDRGEAGSAGDGGEAGGSGRAAGGTSSGGNTAGGGAAGAKGGCTSPLEEMTDGLCVAKVVMVTGGYSIDATEVTRGQYQSWLATSPAFDPTCTPKASPGYEPNADCEANLQEPSDGFEHLPQVCVDWCDAEAYCKGVGKRLCGKIGGGPNPNDKLADATWSQWFNVCSSGGTTLYPYGNTSSAAACNGYDNPNPGFDLVPVGSLPQCQSAVQGYVGVFDLSGNVHEWEDSCVGSGADTFCRVRGGSVVGMLECATDGVGFKTNPGQSNFGIRCCKD